MSFQAAQFCCKHFKEEINDKTPLNIEMWSVLLQYP